MWHCFCLQPRDCPVRMCWNCPQHPHHGRGEQLVLRIVVAQRLKDEERYTGHEEAHLHKQPCGCKSEQHPETEQLIEQQSRESRISPFVETEKISPCHVTSAVNTSELSPTDLLLVPTAAASLVRLGQSHDQPNLECHIAKSTRSAS